MKILWPTKARRLDWSSRGLLLRVTLAMAMLAGPWSGWTQELFEGSIESVPLDVDRMYVKGLQFLGQTQNAQGSWSDGQGSQPAVVGLAVMAMLAHGEDPNNGP